MALNPRYNVFASDYLSGAIFKGKYEFPLIAPIHLSTLEAIPYDRIKRSCGFKSPLWVHFYVFDNRFQTALADPDAYAKYLRNYAGVIGMDNSLYRDLPYVEQIQSVYLNRLTDYRWQALGIPVIPNVVWGDNRSFEFCFDGLPHGSTIAISSYGMMRGRKNLFYFLEGFEAMLGVLHPDNIMFHGKIPFEASYMAEKAGCHIHHIVCHIQQVFSFMEVEHE